VARADRLRAIVLGGGPAGCAAAILCAQRGLPVALVERARFPRHRPGESLHPGIEPLLEQLGLADAVRAAGFLRHAGIRVRWAGAQRFEPFGADEQGPWLGFQAWRADFDAIMLEHARAVGVRVHQPCRALQPLLDGSRVVGIATTDGPLHAPVIVDAAGGSHWLARKLRTRVQAYSPRLIARYGYAAGERPALDAAPAITADRAGWTWIARVRPHLYHWTRLSLQPEAAAGWPADWLPEEFRGLESQGKTRGADVTWRMVIDPAGPGYFLVGDAAAVLDPASSHGVLKAIMSGMMAGHLIAQTLTGACSEQRAALEYSRWLADSFHTDVRRLKQLYGSLPHPPAWSRSSTQQRPDGASFIGSAS
jgi:flavin-dependent dehydrogenase